MVIVSPHTRKEGITSMASAEKIFDAMDEQWEDYKIRMDIWLESLCFMCMLRQIFK